MIAGLSVIASLTFSFDETGSICVQESTRDTEFLLGADSGETTLKSRDATTARTWPTNTLIIGRSPLSDTVVLRKDMTSFSRAFTLAISSTCKFFVFNCVSRLDRRRNIIKDDVNLQIFFKTTKRILTSQEEECRDN